ncbi:hypothetical protein [Saccharomonospora marina]|uniref:hypothetical protein n=1 Tax=Saccharomonospora marina TaxID=632569 RepID=UPI0018DED074|nr:hypothetical protein [Saccharomonospora marina]
MTFIEKPISSRYLDQDDRIEIDSYPDRTHTGKRRRAGERTSTSYTVNLPFCWAHEKSSIPINVDIRQPAPLVATRPQALEDLIQAADEAHTLCPNEALISNPRTRQHHRPGFITVGCSLVVDLHDDRHARTAQPLHHVFDISQLHQYPLSADAMSATPYS